MCVNWGVFQMWPGILDKARRGGLNVIQTYVFWNAHEPEKGKVKCYIHHANSDYSWCVASTYIIRLINVPTCVLVCFIMQFNFEGKNDLVKFIKLVQEKGMYVTLRVGPFIQAEWNHGYAVT